MPLPRPAPTPGYPHNHSGPALNSGLGTLQGIGTGTLQRLCVGTSQGWAQEAAGARFSPWEPSSPPSSGSTLSCPALELQAEARTPRPRAWGLGCPGGPRVSQLSAEADGGGSEGPAAAPAARPRSPPACQPQRAAGTCWPAAGSGEAWQGPRCRALGPLAWPWVFPAGRAETRHPPQAAFVPCCHFPAKAREPAWATVPRGRVAPATSHPRPRPTASRGPA